MMQHEHHYHGPRGHRPGMGWMGPPWMMGGGRRMRRGDVRTALLAALEEGPAHGYELMTKLEEKSEGAWHPSPGSVYPTLQLLEDEGLVRSEERDGKRVYELTDAGRAESKARTERGGQAPWEAGPGEAGKHAPLRQAVFQLGAAVMQIGQTGTEAQMEQAEAILRDARKQIYKILAED